MPPYVTTLDAVAAALAGRPPTAAERDAHDLPALARALATSAEHAEAVLAGTPAALAAHPVGSHSRDGVVRVGTEGWVHLVGDTNQVLAQFAGTYPLPSGWGESWEALVTHHHAVARRLGASAVHIFIPERLPFVRSSCPGLPPQEGPRPLELLCERMGTALTYPLPAMTARHRAGEEVLFRTDSHIAGAGYWECYRAILAKLGLDHDVALERREWRPVLFSGDLGRAFAPRIAELIHYPANPLSYDLVEDDSERVFSSGGHLGARRVLRCHDAPHDATAVVFGDSFSWLDPRRPGGLGELLAATFRETHVVWAPMQIDPGYLGRVGADVVIFEFGERGAVRVPPREIDVRRVADETVGRRARPQGQVATTV